MERVVLYYTNTGNSALLAQRAANALCCEARPVAPVVGRPLMLYLASMLRLPVPCGVSRAELGGYGIILFGPIWGGLLVAPLRAVLRIARRAEVPVHLGITGETREEERSGRFGFDGFFVRRSASPDRCCDPPGCSVPPLWLRRGRNLRSISQIRHGSPTPTSRAPSATASTSS